MPSRMPPRARPRSRPRPAWPIALGRWFDAPPGGAVRAQVDATYYISDQTYTATLEFTVSPRDKAYAGCAVLTTIRSP